MATLPTNLFAAALYGVVGALAWIIGWYAVGVVLAAIRFACHRWLSWHGREALSIAVRCCCGLAALGAVGLAATASMFVLFGIVILVDRTVS